MLYLRSSQATHAPLFLKNQMRDDPLLSSTDSVNGAPPRSNWSAFHWTWIAVVVALAAAVVVLAVLFAHARGSSSTPAASCGPTATIAYEDSSLPAPATIFILGAQIISRPTAALIDANQKVSQLPPVTPNGKSFAPATGVIASAAPAGTEVVPANHTESRVEAGAMYAAYVAAQRNAADGTVRFVISGGYNVGVRYELVNNTVFANANFSSTAFALARDLGPSEAQVMRRVMTTAPFNVSAANVMCEETSATTDENGGVGSIILSRYGLFPTDAQDALPLRIGLLTNLFHMPRALPAFASALQRQNFSATIIPLYAEDWCILNRATPWPQFFESYYAVSRSGLTVNTTRMAEIFRSRLSGDYSVSVAELLPEAQALSESVSDVKAAATERLGSRRRTVIPRNDNNP